MSCEFQGEYSRYYIVSGDVNEGTVHAVMVVDEPKEAKEAKDGES
jgi:hypothetical protein